MKDRFDHYFSGLEGWFTTASLISISNSASVAAGVNHPSKPENSFFEFAISMSAGSCKSLSACRRSLVTRDAARDKLKHIGHTIIMRAWFVRPGTITALS